MKARQVRINNHKRIFAVRLAGRVLGHSSDRCGPEPGVGDATIDTRPVGSWQMGCGLIRRLPGRAAKLQMESMRSVADATAGDHTISLNLVELGQDLLDLHAFRLPAVEGT